MLTGFKVKGWDRKGQAGLSQCWIWRLSSERKLFGKYQCLSKDCSEADTCPASLLILFGSLSALLLSPNLCATVSLLSIRQAHKGAWTGNPSTSTRNICRPSLGTKSVCHLLPPEFGLSLHWHAARASDWPDDSQVSVFQANTGEFLSVSAIT